MSDTETVRVISRNEGRPVRTKLPDRIRIFQSKASPAATIPTNEGSMVFVSIGPGETRVSVMGGDCAISQSWISVFGWAYLCNIDLQMDGKTISLDEEELLARALTGEVRAFGRLLDTSDFVRDVSQWLRAGLEDIITRTVGAAAGHDAIIFSAPFWLHEALKPSTDIRPHIVSEIKDN